MGTILLTGATGYIGGRLLRRLLESGRQVRCMARRPQYLRPRVAPGVEVTAGDVLDRDSLAPALKGVEAAYYLIHSMGAEGGFEESDRIGAANFARAALEAGVKRIIYLGGLGHGDDLSSHLASRQEVGRILRESGVPTLEFRSSIVIGSGSLSYEMVRALAERLPVMVTPRWVGVRTQPIAVEDLLEYLAASLDAPLERSQVVEIGGPDQVSYGELMAEYARQRGLRRVMIPVPVLSPGLSSLWLGLVTPLYARVGRRLIDSLRNETVVLDDSARRVFPSLHPRSLQEAMARALAYEDQTFAATRWSDALSSYRKPPAWGGIRLGSRLIDSRSGFVPVEPARAFRPIRRIGGDRGWYFGNWLWRIRGWLDLLAGGPGTRRGRRDPETVVAGDTLDFWRVESVETDRLLRLSAEMRLPGRAWLQFEVTPEDGGSRIRQTALFDPLGLFGRIYWFTLYPIHQVVFAGMLRGIRDRAVEAE